MNIDGKTTNINELPEPVAGDFLKAHLADKFYFAFIAGRIAIEWGKGHPENPEKIWWRFAKQ
jgi:hypothetical protein